MNSSVFDADTVRALATILADTGLSEIEIEEGDRRIRLSRTVSVVAAPVMAAPAVAAAPAATGAGAEPEADHPGTLASPMVGIAYLSPEPGAPPFIQPGARVSEGQTLLLIEAMKTFNQIKAPRAGIVSRILVSSGAPVEFGEALLVIE